MARPAAARCAPGGGRADARSTAGPWRRAGRAAVADPEAGGGRPATSDRPGAGPQRAWAALRAVPARRVHRRGGDPRSAPPPGPRRWSRPCADLHRAGQPGAPRPRRPRAWCSCAAGAQDPHSPTRPPRAARSARRRPGSRPGCRPRARPPPSARHRRPGPGAGAAGRDCRGRPDRGSSHGADDGSSRCRRRRCACVTCGRAAWPPRRPCCPG